MRPNLPAVLWTMSAAVLIAACAGADSATGVTQRGTTAMLQLTFTGIEVIEDCDGIEGKGDFKFSIEASRDNRPVNHVYAASKTLGRGETARSLGQLTDTVQVGDSATVAVLFVATELDKTVLGKVFADSRLDGASGSVVHRYDGSTWSALGQRIITLGSGTCRVRLMYTATPL
jgi:hypothetical protein